MPIPGGPRPSRTRARTLREVATRLGMADASPDPSSERVVVHGVSLSSRTIRPRDLYVALPGLRAHGADFAAQAARAGAVAVLTDPDGATRARSTGLPTLVVPQPRAVLGALAAWLYGEPASRLLTLAVTGTNGKTTTTFLLDAALRAVGRSTGLVGTVEIRVGDERVDATGTTPEAPDLHALLALMVERGVDACSMEISSHALAQHRVDGLVIDVAGFANLSRDHLDYHVTMQDYYAAKASLFTPEHARRAVVCVDDPWGRRLAGEIEIPVVTASCRPVSGSDSGDARPPADWQVLGTELEAGHTVARVATPAGGAIRLVCPLPGEFNLANSLLALAMLVEAGLDVEPAAAALGQAGPVPGRMERVGSPGDDGAPLAVVDYAHTPDAVAAALNALRGSGHPLVVVLGAGGDRDRDKRPLMGAAAAGAADVVVVTDDNPRFEDPAEIRSVLLDGARPAAERSGAIVLEIADRGHAVAEAVVRAWGAGGTRGGVVLVAGKGHEPGQEVAGAMLPFDDRAVLRAALAAAAGQSRELREMIRP